MTLRREVASNPQENLFTEWQRYSAAGKGLSRLALLLPVGGFVASLVGMVASYREKPPGGLRRIVEIPFEVLAGVLFEALLGLAVAGALLGLLWAAGRKGGRGL